MDRLDEHVRRLARDESLGSRQAGIEEQLTALTSAVEALRAAVPAGPDPMPSAQERLSVGGPGA